MLSITVVWLDLMLASFNAVIHNSCYVFTEQLNLCAIDVVVHLET